MIEQPPDPEERALDSTSALEKVLRLDKKHTNFDYYDPLRKYSFSTFTLPPPPLTQPLTQGRLPPAAARRPLLRDPPKIAVEARLQLLLQTHWGRLAPATALPQGRYRLPLRGYLTPHSGNYRFGESEEFWETAEAIYSDNFLHKYLRGEK